MEEAKRIKDKWIADGQIECNHKSIKKEVSHAGSPTGDFVCMNCGTSGIGPNWNKQDS